MAQADRAGRQAVQIVPTRYGSMIVDPADVYIGRSLISYGEFSPGEAVLFRHILKLGDVVVDAGAHIGAFTLCFANAVGAAGRVYAFEPQRRLFQMLCGSLALNEIDQVEAWPAGLGAEIGEMVAPQPSPSGTPSNTGAPALQDSGPGETVPITTIDNLGLKRCALIKADIQGMEAALLAGAKQTIATCQPILYLENDIREKSPVLLQAVAGLGYRAFWHLPPLFDPQNYNGNTANLFPDIVSINILCVPAGHGGVAGLREVSGPEDWVI